MDYVLHGNGHLVAIEVTSGRRKESLPGMELFARTYRSVRKLLVGG
ncbi:MAG: hypothetical protein QN189_00285 [Armatimonadota bacterium]|nr:hypothetical protein [Armatimonadota bacterium]